MPIDTEKAKSIFDKFIDDKFSSSEEELRTEFVKARDDHLAKELRLEQGEDEEEPEDEEKPPFLKKDKKKKKDGEEEEKEGSEEE
jgi:hypothetical protein